jgi:capsule polysaccharide export protein KpsE/RkpR
MNANQFKDAMKKAIEELRQAENQAKSAHKKLDDYGLGDDNDILELKNEAEALERLIELHKKHNPLAQYSN